jgi:hypothetical protein
MRQHRIIMAVATLTSVVALGTAAFFAVRHFTTPPIQWQTYHEPHGLLTIAMPRTWSASETQTGVTEGIFNGPAFPETVYQITFQAKDHTGMVVFISLTLAPESPGWSAYVCAHQNNFSTPHNTTVAGIPAYYHPVSHNALGHYSFLTSVVGFDTEYRPGPDRSASAALYQHMIQSLMPIPDKPFTC